MAETDSILNIALVQADLAWENVDANLRNFERHFHEISSEVDLVVLPEMFSTGFSMNVNRFAEPMDGRTVRWMQTQAETLDAVVAGSLMIRDGSNFFNRFVFASPDGKIDYYDKRHLFSMGQENIHFSAGRRRLIYQLKGFRILPQICYDLRFPVFARNRNDYDLYLNCANWPAPRKEVWECLLKARAIENQAYVAGVNRVGVDANGIRYSGDSVLLDARGTTIQNVGNEAKVIQASLSLSSLNRFRTKFPVLPDSDEFDLNV